MLSSAELALWAIHHATTLLFGVFASAALCGVEINGRHSLELVGVGAVTGTAFAIANLVGGELFARQVYPLVVHLPLVVYLCVRYRLSPLLSILGVTSAYLSCQFSNWVGIAAFAATDSQVAYYAARIITTLGVFAVLLHWASDIGPRLAIKSPTELEILLILPLVYYIFDYATNVYTTLFHSGSVVTVEFLAFALCAFYLMFLAVYLREYEAKEIAERERWMLATRDSAAIKELEAWRQSGRELSVLRHDMRHYLRGLAALIEEGHTDEALERIDALCETNDRTAVRRYCANETVNIALSSLSADIKRARHHRRPARRRARNRPRGRCRSVQCGIERPGQCHRRGERRPRRQAVCRPGPSLRRRSASIAGFQHVWPCAAHGRRHARGSAHWARLWHQEH